MGNRIPFNRIVVSGAELEYVTQAIRSGNIRGDGSYSRLCCQVLEDRFGVHRVLLTPSCTAALELAAIVCNVSRGDEVILPSFAFPSTANAVVRLGCTPVFVDIRPDTLNMDETLLEAAVSTRTKAVIPVHYGGVACDMDAIMAIARKYALWVIEDSATAVNSFYKGRAVGTIGHFGCYSFHETKNYTCGEGGALCLSSPEFEERAETIRNCGTNRAQFLKGLVDHYEWVDVGSSYAPSEILAAFLYAQLERMDSITERRRKLYDSFSSYLAPLAAEGGLLQLPQIPESCQSNFHTFYIMLRDQTTRDGLMGHLGRVGIQTAFHYLPLHTSPMGRRFGYKPGDLPITEDCSGRILRLPLYCDLSEAEQAYVVREIEAYLHRPTLAVRRASRLT